MFGRDIGIDLGTASVLVYMKGKGIVLQEPSVVAVDKNTNRVMAIGEEARRMIGRTPGNIVAIRPLREGVIADYDITEKMLRYFIQKVCGRSFICKPRIVVCVPSGVKKKKKRAVIEAAIQAGGRKPLLIEEPVAAAIGAGLDISEPRGSMIVDIGGGTTDVAVLSLDGIVVSESIRIAGDKFDDALIRYIRRKYNIMIGERSAEELKINCGTAFLDDTRTSYEIRGRNLMTGLPTNLIITTEETLEAFEEPLDAILNSIRTVLERTPPELAGDISERGIIMTGGGAMLHNLDKLITSKTDIPAILSENAISCVAIGTGKALEYFDKLQKLNKPNRFFLAGK
jgi:rod shape-determining protein MreB